MAGRRWFCEFAVPGTAELLMCGGSVCGKRERSREVLVINQAAGRVGAKSGELGHAARCRLAWQLGRPVFPTQPSPPYFFVSTPAPRPATPSLSVSQQHHESGIHTIGTTAQHEINVTRGGKRGING